MALQEKSVSLPDEPRAWFSTFGAEVKERVEASVTCTYPVVGYGATREIKSKFGYIWHELHMPFPNIVGRDLTFERWKFNAALEAVYRSLGLSFGGVEEGWEPMYPDLYKHGKDKTQYRFSNTKNPNVVWLGLKFEADVSGMKSETCQEVLLFYSSIKKEEDFLEILYPVY